MPDHYSEYSVVKPGTLEAFSPNEFAKALDAFIKKPQVLLAEPHEFAVKKSQDSNAFEDASWPLKKLQARVQLEFKAYVALLEYLGVSVNIMPPGLGRRDSVYVTDTSHHCLIFKGTQQQQVQMQCQLVLAQMAQSFLRWLFTSTP